MASFKSVSSVATKIARKGHTVVWFRNDQRVLDNPILHEAVRRNEPVICVYCFDPRHYATTKYGSPKTGAYRCKFLVESIQDLRLSLKELGSELLVAMGEPEVIIPELTSLNSGGSGICEVLVQKEYAWEEACVADRVEAAIRSRGEGGMLRAIDGATLFHKDDLPYKHDLSDLPDVFSPFKNKVEKVCKPRPLVPNPKKGQLKTVAFESLGEGIRTMDKCGYDFMPSEKDLGLDEGAFEAAGLGTQRGGVLDFHGGERAGKARVEDWIFTKDKLKEYFDIRNGMLGEGYSSKFSPWLATGNLSPRWIQKECARYEKETGIANKSTYWLIFELEVRDFFHFLVTKYGRKSFFRGGMRGVERPWGTDEERIRRWKEGTTGMPLVDANMRELKATGWMSNRGRQNVASYLVLDMGIDWRVGADHFESLLLDHDVYSNYGNWNAAAGLTSGRVNRFNVVKQSKDYDSNGDYIRHWIPELADVPAPLVFEPSKMSPGDRLRFKAEAYPSVMKLGQPWTPPAQEGTHNGGGKGKGKGGRGKGGDGGGGAGRQAGHVKKPKVPKGGRGDDVVWYVKS